MRQDSPRLELLRRLMILDSSPERDFDHILKLLTDTLQVPIAMVSLLDAERDWFKACVGFALSESPASTSFCESFFHSSADVIVVEDTLQDLRFAAHPLVVATPFIRFYAAARLTVMGHTVGTLCAYDMKPHRLSIDQTEQLRSLGGATELLLQRRLLDPAVQD
jgi:GAF domain-containing protein